MSVVRTPLEFVQSRGLPHRRMEEWKYTDLRSAIAPEAVARPDGLQWRIQNLPTEVEQVNIGTEGLPSWAAAIVPRGDGDDTMSVAARMLVRNGVALRIPTGAKPSAPINLEIGSHGHGQAIVVVEDGASVTLVESHHSDGDELRNFWILLHLGDGARVRHVRISPFVPELVTIENIVVAHGNGSHYVAHVLTGGAKLSRTKFDVRMAREGTTTELSGVSILGNGAHADITTEIHHAVPNTTSRQLFKYVAGGKSRAVYQGKITVREGAVGSDSRQTAKALLLSDRAEADLKPELEILADDVKCAHGAAVGDLDADSLFYLRSRGIPESEARGLLIHAFLQEVVDGIEDEGLRGTAVEFIESGLAWAMESAS